MDVICKQLSPFLAKDLLPLTVGYVGPICVSIMVVDGMEFPMYILSCHYDPEYINIAADADDNPFVYEYEHDDLYTTYTHLSGIITYRVLTQSEHVLHDNCMYHMYTTSDHLYITRESFEYGYERNTVFCKYDQGYCPQFTTYTIDNSVYIRTLPHDEWIYYKLQFHPKPILKAIEYNPELPIPLTYTYEGDTYLMDILRPLSNILRITIRLERYPDHIVIRKNIKFSEQIQLHKSLYVVVLVNYRDKLYSVKSKQEIFRHVMETRQTQGCCSCS